MKKLNILIIIFMLVGCCVAKNSINFEPKIIPDGNVGKLYYMKLETDFVIYDINLSKSNSDNGLNLKVIYPTEEGGASRGIFEIEGIPQHEGVAQLIVEGSTPGTSCTGQHFKKTFTVIILGEKTGPNAKIIAPTDTKVTTTCL